MKSNTAISKQKRKRESSPEPNVGSSNGSEDQKTRGKSLRAASKAPSNVAAAAGSRVTINPSEGLGHRSAVKLFAPQVVLYKYLPTDPIAVAFRQQLSQLSPVVTLNIGSGNLATLPEDFIFIEYLKLGKGAIAYDKQFVVGCSCPPGASGCKDMKNCCCIEEPGTFTYSRPNILREGRSNEKPIFECHQGCACGTDCRNRVVQRGRQLPLELFWAGAKGWGIRCPEQIPRGRLIDKYFGEVVGPREASRRANINEKKGVTYLFDLDKFENPRAQYHSIDGEHMGGITRFINHSCDPNLTVYAVVSDRRDTKVYDIAFFTNRVIYPGEELTYDYSECLESDVVKYVTSWDCSCASPRCRGRIF